MKKEKIKGYYRKVIGILKDVAPIIVSIAAVMIAYSMKEISKEQNDISLNNFIENRQIDIRAQKINEGQLVAGLLPSLVHGTEKEKKIAITLIDSLSINMSRIIFPIIIEKETNESVSQFAKQTYESSKFREEIKNALLSEMTNKYERSAYYFITATKYIEISKQDSATLETAIIQYNKGEYIKSIEIFKKLFKLKNKEN